MTDACLNKTEHEPADEIEQMARECGFECIGRTDASELVARTEVRDMCAVDKCHMYGKTWACPPACGSIDEYQEQFKQYSTCLVVQSVGHMEDDFDVETMMETERLQKERFSNLVDKVRKTDHKALYLAAGACDVCSTCTYPDKPCRFPDKMLTSMEASGLVVGDVCLQANIPYNHGPQTIAYTSCVVY